MSLRDVVVHEDNCLKNANAIEEARYGSCQICRVIGMDRERQPCHLTTGTTLVQRFEEEGGRQPLRI